MARALDRPLGIALLAISGLAALLVQAAGPARKPPLYDGVVVEDPYEWLNPPPGYPGDAEGATDTVDVVGGENRIVAVFTAEQPPQAQVLAQRGALKVGSGATTVTVSITPVEVDATPADGYLDGNAYEIVVVDDLGRPALPRKGADVSVVLRPADDNDLSGTIEAFDGTTWKPLATGGGGPFAFEAVVSEFGDFAVVAKGSSPYPTYPPTAAATEVATAGASPATVPPSAPDTPSAAASPAPESGTEPAIPLGSIAAIVVGVVGLVALFVLSGRPRRRDRRRR